MHGSLNVKIIASFLISYFLSDGAVLRELRIAGNAYLLFRSVKPIILM
jgi:hypothetical protein